MKSAVESEDPSYAANIVGVSSYEAPMPSQRVKDDFLAWHRPRKQYVRKYQWCREVNFLIRDNPPIDGALKYLGLPGVDLLDIRNFHAEVCEKNEIQLKFLGFNRSARSNGDAQADLNIALSEVRGLRYVNPLSDVIGDDFARISNRQSVAFQRACQFGPYDVINLDLCDGFGVHEPGILTDSYYNALNNLMAIQARSANPWLLFLTTRADMGSINKEVLEKLIKIYCSNIEQCLSFRDASAEKFGIDTNEAVENATKNPEGLLRVFLTGLCKWFLSLGLSCRPKISVELCSAIGYRTGKSEGSEDLMSLALKFTPTVIPVPDRHGLAANPIDDLNEGSLATKALHRVAGRRNADKILLDNSDILQCMIDETANLLSMARYDREKYLAWVARA